MGRNFYVRYGGSQWLPSLQFTKISIILQYINYDRRKWTKLLDQRHKQGVLNES